MDVGWAELVRMINNKFGRKCLPMKPLRRRGDPMLDVFYLAVGCICLVVFWYFTKACEKL
jgi:hypothetical protein